MTARPKASGLEMLRAVSSALGRGALAFILLLGPAFPSAGQSATHLSQVDSVYFAGDAAGALALLDGSASALTGAEGRWRAIRSHLALGLMFPPGNDRNHHLDPGLRVAEVIENGTQATTDELYYAAAVLGLRALRAAPRYSAELAPRARTSALRVLNADSRHGGAHHVLGWIDWELSRLSRTERLVARVLFGRNYPSGADRASAEQHLRQAADLWPHMVLFQLDLALFLEDQGRPAEAGQIARRAIATPSLHPPDPILKDQARDLLARIEQR